MTTHTKINPKQSGREMWQDIKRELHKRHINILKRQWIKDIIFQQALEIKR